MIWIALLVRWGINTLALIVIDWMFSGVEIGRWVSLLFAAAILTIGNTIIKPILAILTLPLIILTFGLAYFASRCSCSRCDRNGCRRNVAMASLRNIRVTAPWCLVASSIAPDAS